jgi:hypothetical protein
MQVEIVWHYTTEGKLDDIISSGVLRISQWEKKMGFPKPSLWFSKNPDWEPTATKMAMDENQVPIKLTRQEQYELDGLGRIAIKYSQELISWAKYRRVSGLDESLLDRMELTGREKGASPSDWFASLKNIYERDWIAIEFWDGNGWVSYWES